MTHSIHDHSEHSSHPQEAPERTLDAVESNALSLAAFEAKSKEMSAVIPELTQNPEIILAGNVLIDQFAIEPAFFKSDDRSVIFAGLSSKWLEANRQPGDQDAAEKAFVTNALTLLAKDYSPLFAEAKADIDIIDNPLSNEAALEVYDKYTNEALSGEVTRSIGEGLLADLQARLGVTAENEHPYEVRVLDISDGRQLDGIDAPEPNYDLPYDHPDYIAALAAQDDMRSWKQSLEANAEAMRAELHTDHTSPAWIATYGDRTLLCISTGLAKKLLDPGIIENTSWYSQDDLKRDFAFLEHEYTHTQEGIMVDNDVKFGISLEERRAEYFSGDKHGYADTKGFFSDYGVLTGHVITDEFDAFPMGGTAADLLGAVANHTNLALMAELAMIVPNPYKEAQRGTVYGAAIQDYIGGYDGFEQKLLAAQLDAGNGAAIEERVTKVANKLMQIGAGSDDDFSDFWAGHRRAQGLGLMTDVIKAKIDELSA